MVFYLRTNKMLASVMFSIESFIECIERKDSVVVDLYDEIKKPKAKETMLCIGMVTYTNLNGYQESIWIDIVPEEKVQQTLRILRGVDFNKRAVKIP